MKLDLSTIIDHVGSFMMHMDIRSFRHDPTITCGEFRLICLDVVKMNGGFEEIKELDFKLEDNFGNSSPSAVLILYSNRDGARDRSFKNSRKITVRQAIYHYNKCHVANITKIPPFPKL